MFSICHLDTFIVTFVRKPLKHGLVQSEAARFAKPPVFIQCFLSIINARLNCSFINTLQVC